MTERDTAFLHEQMPLCRTLGIVAGSRFGPEQVDLEVEWSASLCTAGGILHGGVVMALADSAGGIGAYFNLASPNQRTATIESKTNFLGAVRSGTLTATSTPLHIGSSTIVVETEVRDSAKNLVAKVTQTQAILGRA
jgi:1,4-dihydroxy-2-naphthoyl-CoA hydrolase